MAEKPKVTSAGSINVSKQFAANKSTTPAASKSAAAKVAQQTLNLYGAPKPAPTFTYGLGSPTQTKITKPGQTLPTTTQKTKSTGQKTGGAQPGVGPITGVGNTFIPGYTPSGDTGSGGQTPIAKTIISRTPRLDSKGKIIGWDIVYSDGTRDFESNPDYKPEDESKKVANVSYDTIQKILESYRITGLASVLETIRDEYPEASSEDILTLLQFDDRYNAKFNERFSANVKRQKAGKSVYSPGEYLAMEEGFQKVFDSYNLPTFKTQSYYDKFIEGDVDVVEVTDRVQLAYDRVLSDDPVNRAFKQFYSSLGFSDIVAGMLDPVNQLPALQQKVKAAEIGGAALRQGLTASELGTRETLGAGILAGQNISKAQAEEGYKYVAGVLPTAEKLSSIYGKTEEKYGRLEAEQEKFQGLASAERKRKRISELELAQFQGSSGVSEAGLSTSYLRKGSSAGQF
jgi:hypothetical protein